MAHRLPTKQASYPKNGQRHSERKQWRLFFFFLLSEQNPGKMRWIEHMGPGLGNRTRTRGSASIAESPTSIFPVAVRKIMESLASRGTLSSALRHSTAAVCGLPRCRTSSRVVPYANETNGRTANPAPDYKAYVTFSPPLQLPLPGIPPPGLCNELAYSITVYSIICGVRGTHSRVPNFPKGGSRPST